MRRIRSRIRDRLRVYADVAATARAYARRDNARRATRTGRQQMEEGLQLSARFVASILARIYGPSIYDTPRLGGGGPLRYLILDPIAGPRPEPWREVALNPQPLPPRAVYTV